MILESFLPAAAPPALLACVAVGALMLSDYRAWRIGRFLFKPLAAAAFLWLALRLDATQTAYGSWLLGGLACCALGDLLLMPDDERAFLAGLGAFLIGHLLYSTAFLQLPLNPAGSLLSALPALLLLTLVLRWLLPHVPGNMRLPVALYVVVITAMLVTAGATAGQALAPMAIIGAWCFALSDVAVARRQFVSRSRASALWGTPLYFFAQMLIAASVAFA
ncbi:MAG: lysoplasmalogenase, partial [Halioglobus sp.]|nr:lysoplasmalogenase [Halioglobus sp.]